MNQIFTDSLFILCCLFLFVFRRTERKGFFKGAFGPHEPKVYRFSFYFGLFIFSLFLEEQRERIFYKGGPSAPMNQRFSDSLFTLGCLFSLCFFWRTREKGFLLSKQSFEQGFV
jgi:hypothetical protein